MTPRSVLCGPSLRPLAGPVRVSLAPDAPAPIFRRREYAPRPARPAAEPLPACAFSGCARPRSVGRRGCPPEVLCLCFVHRSWITQHAKRHGRTLAAQLAASGVAS